MASNDAIKVELQRLISLAKKLSDEAEKLNGIVGNEYAASLTQLTKYWGGENATGLVAAGKKLGENLASMVKQIMEAATTLESSAEAYARAEMTAEARS